MSGKRVNQPLHVPRHRRNGVPAGPAWPSFNGEAQEVGASPTGAVTVYVDPALGEPGLENAQQLLGAADDVVGKNGAIFGLNGENKHVDVLVYALGGATDGTGGADHGGCNFKTGNAIEVDASFGNAKRVIGLFEAELSECAMQGRLCGLSTGEALSRWCATVVSENALADFETAPQWAEAGMPNWVDRTDDTDRDDLSTGCGMAFISWLLSEGYPLEEIAQSMVSLRDEGTLAELYAGLTEQPEEAAWNTFKKAVEALPGGVTSDDPFNGAALAVAA